MKLPLDPSGSVLYIFGLCDSCGKRFIMRTVVRVSDFMERSNVPLPYGVIPKTLGIGRQADTRKLEARTRVSPHETAPEGVTKEQIDASIYADSREPEKARCPQCGGRFDVWNVIMGAMEQAYGPNYPERMIAEITEQIEQEPLD